MSGSDKMLKSIYKRHKDRGIRNVYGEKKSAKSLLSNVRKAHEKAGIANPYK